MRIFVAMKSVFWAQKSPDEHAKFKCKKLIYLVLILNYLIMNKKIFTLMAVSLAMFLTSFAVNALNLGDTVRALPANVLNEKAYHLAITGIGDRVVTDTIVIMDEKGYLKMVPTSAISTSVTPGIDYEGLRQSLWCVNVEQATAGDQPDFYFYNKVADRPLSVTNGRWKDPAAVSFPAIPSRSNADWYIQTYGTGTNTDILTGGPEDAWRRSLKTSYNASLAVNQPLYREVEDDYYLTFIAGTDGILTLAKVHGTDLNLNGQDTATFYKSVVVKFTLIEAAPFILDAAAFNTKLGTQDASAGVKLKIDPNPTEASPFTELLFASAVSGGAGTAGYIKLGATTKNNLITVLDGDDANNYVNYLNKRYPKITTQSAVVTSGEQEFRAVYYPSNDSLLLNVRRIEHIQYGDVYDDLTSRYNTFWNDTIVNFLTVRLQDLQYSPRRTVLTIGDQPPQMKLSLDVQNCKAVGSTRTTVATDLYVIQNTDGAYLTIPLHTGDFVPQWEPLDYGEDPYKIPSAQWLVIKNSESSAISTVDLVNREFNWFRIEHVQLYTDAHASFDGVDVSSLFEVGTGHNEVPNYIGKKETYADLFTVVPAPYRNDEHLGYKYLSKQELEYYSYAFNWDSYLSNDYYLNASGVRPDTLLRLKDNDKTYFRLVLPDTLDAYGTEKYGIGWSDADGQGLKTLLADKFGDPTDKDTYIAPLERYYYRFHINDPFKFDLVDDVITLDPNLQYGYTDKATYDANPLNHEKFYLRYDHDKALIAGAEAVEFYTLLDRVDKSNFNYMAQELHLALTDTLKAYEWSHGTIKEKAFGVITAGVTPNEHVLIAQPKTLSTIVSTFALSTFNEPLYRTFDPADPAITCAPGGEAPTTIKIHRYSNPLEYLYEDQFSTWSYGLMGINRGPFVWGKGIKFLGVENQAEHDKAVADPKVNHLDHNYSIYLDTAYVNRPAYAGAVGITPKPQYLLAVGDLQLYNGGRGCYACGDSFDIEPFKLGRYLINATDSARQNPDAVCSGLIIRDKDYIYDSQWDRLAFVYAIHAGDYLYILGADDPFEGGILSDTKVYGVDAYGNKYVDLNALAAKLPVDNIVFLGDNTHKDVVFSFRYIQRQVKNDGTPDPSASKVFLIESESECRGVSPIIAPRIGGWVKLHSGNGVPVLSRGSYDDMILEAEKWDAECGDLEAGTDPLANDKVSASSISVVAGAGSVTILNAAGKNVTISNILGQAVAKTAIASDNVTVAAPAGVVIVAIEGESAVKAVVK